MRKPNRLIKEKSPYLRQHAYNPVDWYPWSEEAFQKAKREDKPIFLSIGYSTCHWCHVMEKESFEDEEIARILNEYFVPIKVDREERPDIDALYMAVCQALTGSGGWPLTIIMTPDKEPFFAATYLPKESFWGRPGLKEILLAVKEAWEKDREKLVRSGRYILQALREASQEKGGGELGEDTLHRAYGELFSSYDEHFGGFGGAPKFPVPHNLLFLNRYYYRYQKEQALQMVVKTLTAMRMGGIYDQVGFGFHRYSTDREWRLPHFEKMLYDQALLLMAYAEGFILTGRELFHETAEEITQFLVRDMLSPEGGFYSSWDADSEGEEGKFYTWSLGELKRILDGGELELALKVFNLKEEGNFLEEATKKTTGRNILHIGKTYEEVARELGLSPKELKERLNIIRQKLFRAREGRPKPLRDEKILTDWNGLAIAALARSGRLLKKEDWIELARKAASFILSTMRDEKGLLMHRYYHGEVKYYGLLEDYAYLIWGLIELYQATLKGDYLEEAVKLQKMQINLFYDEERGGFFQTPYFVKDIPLRKKEVYDGALPSGNSVSAYNLTVLARLTGRSELESLARKTLEAFSWEIRNFPSAHTFSLIALDLLVNGSAELFILPAGEDWKELKSTLDGEFLPDLYTLLLEEKLKELSPFLKSLKGEGKTTYYLCERFSCRRPTTDIKEVLREVRERRRAQ